MRVRASCLSLALLAACAPGRGGGSPAETMDPCQDVPDNGTAGTASQLLPNEDNVARYCRGVSKGTQWWTLPGSYPGASRWRLQVRFDRGSRAEDLDFRMGVLNSAGNGVDGRVTLGGCGQAAGQTEDCVLDLPARDTPYDALFVLGWPATPQTEREVFRIRVGEYQGPQTGP